MLATAVCILVQAAIYSPDPLIIDIQRHLQETAPFMKLSSFMKETQGQFKMNHYDTQYTVTYALGDLAFFNDKKTGERMFVKSEDLIKCK